MPPKIFPVSCPLRVAFCCMLVSAAHAEQVIISEISYHPSEGKPEFIEVTNVTATPFDISKWKLRDAVHYDFPEFSAADPQASFLGAFETILLAGADEASVRTAYPGIPANVPIFGPWTGSLDNAGERIELKDRNGTLVCGVSYDDGDGWPVAADGTGLTLVVKNKNRAIDNWRNWQTGASVHGSPGRLDDGDVELLVAGFDSNWRYYHETDAPPPDWKETGFDDSSWSEGATLMGYESFSFPHDIATPLNRTQLTGVVTYYFRKTFNFNLQPEGAQLIVDQRVDDGVVYYLNGVELTRIRMPGGTITHTTTAQNSFEATTLETGAVDQDVSALIQPGLNVITAELHNRPASSDAVFGASIRVLAAPLSEVSPVRINEIHYGAAGEVDWIEFFNDSESAASAGFMVATEPDFSDFVLLTESIPAGGFVSLDVDFPASGNDTTLFLKSPGGEIADAVRLEKRPSHTGFQAWPDGSGVFYGGTADTRDAANAPARETNIVINEIMADPPSNLTRGEFIELYNRGTAAVDLSGWAFTKGVDFTFPSGISIAPGGYLVIAADRDHILDVYGAIPVIGNFSGKLRNDGELLRLVDAEGNPADEVDYQTGGDWPALANGDGPSLELLNPEMDNSLSGAWRDSDESQKSSFQTYTHTGTYLDFGDERIGTVASYKEFHFHLAGDSHLVLKNISIVKNGSGSNILNNSANMTPNGSGGSGWLAQGTHADSYFDGDEFHLISTGHGDNRPNKAEIDALTLNANDEITLTFEARWISGRPRLIAQTFDHSFMQSFLVEIPENLGTPGGQNSVHRNSPPAQVNGLMHSPSVPSSNDNVQVFAEISSVATPTVRLYYREDTIAGNAAWSSLPMSDTGNGRYLATITDQKSQARVVQFYVEATGQNGEKTTQPRLGAARPALYVVDNTKMDDSLTGFRFVVSQYDLNAFQNGSGAAYDYRFPRLSNAYKNMTLIVNEEDIIYNCEIRPAGSPWHANDRQNLNNRGKWKMPGDNYFRGKRKLTFDLEGAGTLHHNRICRYWLYLMGHPVNENEFCVTKENAKSEVFREIVEPVDVDLLNRHWEEGSDGELYRIDDIFRFDDSYNKDQITNRFWWYAGSQYPGPGRYHTQWLKRSRQGEYDYSALINLLKTVSENTYTQEEIERLIDPVRVCQIAAVRGYIGDWDSFTINRPKNSFFYRTPDEGRFMFFHWDSDLGFRSGEPLFNGGTEFGNWIRKPYNRRLFRYYLAEMLDKFTAGSDRLTAWFDAEDAASNRYNVSRGTYTGFFSNRLSRVNTELGSGYNLAFSASAPASTSADTVTVTGSAGYKVFDIQVVGHPEAKVRWLTETTWEIENIHLQGGNNSLEIIGVDDDGIPVASQGEILTINKTTGAPPVLALESDPPSGRLPVTSEVTLDATESFDPDGNPLAFTWTPPASGIADFTDHGDGTATALFSAPGLYEFTVEADDSADSPVSRSIEIAVYGAAGFSNFGDNVIEPYWEEVNVEAFDNHPAGSYHSLAEVPGYVTLSVPGDKAYPLGFDPGQGPDLPDPLIYVDMGDTYSYDNSGNDLGTSWSTLAFDDSAWSAGPGLFGFDSGSHAAPGIQTNILNLGVTTYYLRREFQFDRDPVGSLITMDADLDDGAVFYINGQEIGRFNMPAGTVDYLTTAAGHINPEGELHTDVAVADGSVILQEGTNVLAVSVHNATSGSPDIVYGGRLKIAAHESGGGSNTISSTHPWLRRPMPATGDWVLQGDFKLQTIQFGDFMAGVMVEMEINSIPVRYAVGYKDGSEAAVVSVSPGGVETTLGSLPYTADTGMTVRIRRAGDVLFFEVLDAADQWQLIHQLNAGATATAVHGGPFAATGFNDGTGMKAAFDYVMLINPSGVSTHKGDLLISEIMYHPADTETLEFIELYNASDTAIDLEGFQFLEGEPFENYTFGDVTIQPGQYLLLVADETAFGTAWPGLAAQVIGSWGTGRLSNGGESVTLVDSSGSLVAGFTYKDKSPWPETADGLGPSIVLIDPDSAPEPGLAENWRASTFDGGSPGAADPAGQTFAQWMTDRGLTDPDADDDGNGLSNLLDYALGADLTADSVWPVAESLTGHSGIAFRLRSEDTSLTYTVEASSDLILWSIDPADVAPFGEPADNGDGTLTVRYRSESAGNGYLRLRVTTAE